MLVVIPYIFSFDASFINNDFPGNYKDIPKGWCFVWPSQVTHPHVAYPLISGTKYSLSSWTHPVEWDQNKLKGSISYNEC